MLFRLLLVQAAQPPLHRIQPLAAPPPPTAFQLRIYISKRVTFLRPIYTSLFHHEIRRQCRAAMSPTLTSGEGNQQLCKTTNVTLLNDFYTDYPQAHVEKPLVEFSLFPSLPHEICSAIWKCNLRRHRLISIQVTDEDDTACPSGPSSSLPYTDTNGLGNIISKRNYRLSVTSNHRLSPLLQVCHGSRRAALEFYRLHIPYDLKAHGEQHCLYLNPEFDFLHIKQRGAPELFVDLLHDAKAYDPLGAGLLNVGIGEIHPEDLQLPMSTEKSRHVDCLTNSF